MKEFERVRKIGLKLPDVEESTSYGTPALKVKGKLFARLKEDGESLVVHVDLEARDGLIDARPDILFLTEHYVNYPWMLVRLGVATKDELAALLDESYRFATRNVKKPAAKKKAALPAKKLAAKKKKASTRP